MNNFAVFPSQKKQLPAWAESVMYAAAFVLTAVLYFTLKPLYEVEGTRGVAAHSAAALIIILLSAATLYFLITRQLTARMALCFVVAAGFALRVCYMLMTPASYRQMDMAYGDSYGHMGYAWGLFTTGKLPDNNYYQLSHPPLNALLQAGFMHIIETMAQTFEGMFGKNILAPDGLLAGLPSGMDAYSYKLYSTCQILSVLYSFIAAVTAVKILKLFGMEGWALAFFGAFVVFFPRGVQLAGALNNDILSFMFSMLALYYALKWWKSGLNLTNILLCGLFLGLGMMTKMASATIALPVAGIFVWEFASTLKKRDGAMPLKKMIVQYALFLAVCAPLGLWFQIYAHAKFGQPFGYVFDNLVGTLSTADRSAFERFSPIVFDFDEYFGSLWCITHKGADYSNSYNLLHFALRSSIFGEFGYDAGEGFAATAVIFAYVALISATIAAVRALYLFFSRKDADEGEKRDLLFTALLVASQVVSEIVFYVKMPYSCTMDFRYIMPLIPGMAMCMYLSLKRLSAEGDRFSVAVSRVTFVSVIVFLFSSVLFNMTLI